MGDRHFSGYAARGIDRVQSGYNSWVNMRQRCRNEKNPKYPQYGGRGITICERWDSFLNFLEDMGPRPGAKYSIDRIDVDGNYEPGNCRWATNTTQSRNRTNNKLITVNGETLTQSQWARRLGVGDHVIYTRLRAGWPPERAVSEPVGSN